MSDSVKKDLREEPLAGSVNLTELEMAEAVADWVHKRYGFKLGDWKAAVSFSGGACWVVRWTRKGVQLP